MNEEERAARVGHVLQHFIAGGYGADLDQERQRVFLNDTVCIPLPIFADALRVARQTSERDGLVPCGTVIAAAVGIAQKRNPEMYRNQGGGMAKPKWFRRMEQGQRVFDHLQIAGSQHKESTA